MTSPRNAISMLPQDSPENAISPTLGRYSYVLEGLLYALEVAKHIKKSEVSLCDCEKFLNYLSLYLLRNKIIKTK